MSNFRAIAAVTQVLKEFLSNGLTDAGLTAAVTALPLDKIDTGTSEDNQLNLYMYMTNPNAGWRNRDFPSRNSQGQRVNNPYLALDLHYMLTAFGEEEFDAEQLLGCGMLLFHELGVLPRNLIDIELTNPLSTAGLSEQLEQIKITQDILSTEEVSRLWTIFGAKHRQSAYYKVTVVLIESEKPARPALPVKKPLIYVQPFKQPVITKVSSRATAADPIIDNQKILAGYELVIKGTQLKGDITSVNISGETYNNFVSIENDQLIIPVPDIKAGLHSVQVIHEINMGEPPVPHKGFTSSAEAFVLSPKIEEPIGVDASKTIKINTSPVIKVGQKVTLFLNEFTNTDKAFVFSINTEDPDQKINPIEYELDKEFPIREYLEFPTGKYLVRLRVDNAESQIANDYQTPMIEIT